MSIPLRCALAQIKRLSSRLNHLSIRSQAWSSSPVAAMTSFTPAAKPSALTHRTNGCFICSSSTELILPPGFDINQQHPYQQQQLRGFSSKKKKKVKVSAKKKHEMKMQAKRMEANKAAAEDESSERNQVAEQHNEWVEFQKSIAVEGFETGQVTEALKGAKNRRKAQKVAYRRLKARVEKDKDRQKYLKVSGGTFPPLSYSPEETARLLAQAEAALPKRDGKRGTRNLKRQRYRWWLVRQIRKKQKRNIYRAHLRRMEERSRRVRLVKEVLRNASERQAKDRDYQLESFKRWAAKTGQPLHDADDDSEWEDIDEGDGKGQKIKQQM
mmetsp:Transcript_29314/g.80517  ORF Transcript_29314/g.80517 Transcript_29314/m.80517 type:complete len:327 (+) Transcript_29314:52-1032(+)